MASRSSKKIIYATIGSIADESAENLVFELHDNL
jgi:hypothetical protein